MRYRGQSFEIEVALTEAMVTSGDIQAIAAAFHRAHAAIYDFADEAADVHLVNLRLVIAGATPRPAFPTLPLASGKPLPERDVAVWYDGRNQTMPLFLRDALLHGHRLTGPAIVAQEDTTICIPAGFAGTVDGHGNLHLEWQE
jgi:N-methylhydantoinase A